MPIQIDYQMAAGKPVFSIENLTSNDLQLLKLFIEDGLNNTDKNAITIHEINRMNDLIKEFENNLYTHNNGRK